jgi:hypothetical protein
MTRRPLAGALLAWVIAGPGSADALQAQIASIDTPPSAGPTKNRGLEWSVLRVPGTPAAMLAAAGIDRSPGAPRVVFEVIRRVHGTPADANPDSSETFRRFAAYLSLVSEFDRLVRAAGLEASALDATRLASRQGPALASVLGMAGYRTRTSAAGAVVEDLGDAEATERRRRLREAGADLEGLDKRIAAGERVDVSLPAFHVPSPVDERTWKQLLGDGSEGSSVATRLLQDRRASLLYYGLSVMDRETLAYVAGDGALLRALLAEAAWSLAAFGDALRIRGGRVALPGGPSAVPIWESLVGERASSTPAFVVRLLTRDRGRLAFFLETVAALGEGAQRFALAAVLPDPSDRRKAVTRLYAVFASFEPAWQPSQRPFVRQVPDPARWLAEVHTTPQGTWPGPRSRAFWRRALDAGSVSEEAARDHGKGVPGDDVDAAWLAAEVMLGSPNEARLRGEATLFAQRVFGESAEGTGDRMIVVRGFLRFPALMITLERLGVRDHATYASAARRASQLSSIADPARAAIAVAAFQAALFLLERSVWADVVTPDRAGGLVRALVAVEPRGDRYVGGLAEWVESQWMPALGITAGDGEDGMLLALAGGTREGRQRPATTFEWEGERYALDLVTAEQRRLSALRARHDGARLDVVIEVARLARTIRRTAPVPGAVEAVSPTLAEWAKTLRRPPGVAGLQAADLPDVTRQLQEMSEASARGMGTVQIAERLGWIADVLLADALVSIGYALTLGDPDGPVARVGQIASRHDLAVSGRGVDAPAAWTMALPAQGRGAGWSMRGGLLLLDLAMAPLAPRHLATDFVVPESEPSISGPVQASLARTLVLWNPRRHDDRTRDAMADAIRRGRARLARAAGDTAALEEALAAAGVTPLRRNLWRWSLVHDPEQAASLVSLGEVFLLGGGTWSAAAGTLAWATEAVSRSGCACLDAPLAEGPLSLGRPANGLLGAALPDVGLRVVEVSAERGWPAGLSRALLAGAVYDLPFDASPLHDSDWLGVVLGTGAITRERLEDYLAVLTFDGPLTVVPAPDPRP